METQHLLPSITATNLARPGRFAPWMRRVRRLVSMWLSRSRQRQKLGVLDAAALMDIGLSPRDVERETSKFFWQL